MHIWFGLLQYGSTPCNLGRFDEAVATLEKADELCPGHDSVKVFPALVLASAGRSREAVSILIMLALDRVNGDDLERYQGALRNYPADLASWDKHAPGRAEPRRRKDAPDASASP